MARSRGRLRPVDDARSTGHVGARLRLLRETAGLSQETAAVRAGLTRNTLGRLEAEALPDPRLSTLLSLMELYRMTSLEDLLGVSPSRSLLQDWVAEGRPGLRANAALEGSPRPARRGDE